MLKQLSLAALVMITTFANVAQADEKSRIACPLNKSETLFVYPADEAVTLQHFLRSEEALSINQFLTMRCPNCFSFEGELNGKSFKGSLRGVRANNTFVPVLKLNRNGFEQPEITCQNEQI